MNPIRRTRPIPLDGLERALREGRHRRRKAAAVAGAPALSLVVALVLVLQGGSGGKDSIGTLNDPVTSTETSEPTATDTPSPGESTEPSGDAEARPEPSTEEPVSEAECDDDGCSEEYDFEPIATPAPHGDPIQRTDSHQTLPYTSTRCTTFQPNPNAYLLCARTYAISPDLTISPGETVTVGYEVCRGVDAKTEDLEVRWESGQEHEGYATTSSSPGTIVWQESDVTTWMGGPHSDTLRQQTCFVWTFSWQGYGSDGPVDAGTYLLSGAMTVTGGESEPFAGVEVTVTR